MSKHKFLHSESANGLLGHLCTKYGPKQRGLSILSLVERFKQEVSEKFDLLALDKHVFALCYYFPRSIAGSN